MAANAAYTTMIITNLDQPSTAASQPPIEIHGSTDAACPESIGIPDATSSCSPAPVERRKRVTYKEVVWLILEIHAALRQVQGRASTRRVTVSEVLQLVAKMSATGKSYDETDGGRVQYTRAYKYPWDTTEVSAKREGDRVNVSFSRGSNGRVFVSATIADWLAAYVPPSSPSPQDSVWKRTKTKHLFERIDLKGRRIGYAIELPDPTGRNWRPEFVVGATRAEVAAKEGSAIVELVRKAATCAPLRGAVERYVRYYPEIRAALAAEPLPVFAGNEKWFAEIAKAYLKAESRKGRIARHHQPGATIEVAA